MISLVKKYETDIGDLTSQINDKTVFISGWDKDPDILNIDDNIILESIFMREHENTYIMSKNMEAVKDNICRYLAAECVDLSQITRKNTTICSNASIAGFLSLLQSIKRKNKKIAIIGPIFFTYMNMCIQMGVEIYNIEVDIFSNLLNEKLFEDYEAIKKLGIKSILLINPLLRTGVELHKDVIKRLAEMCREDGILLIIDNVYGNMEWDKRLALCDTELISIATSMPNVIVFDSISKRIFKNGIKSAVIYSCEEIICDMEKDAEFFVGSVTYLQEALLYNVFAPKYENIIKDSIVQALSLSKSNYYRIKKYIDENGLDVELTETNNGYFTLARMEKSLFGLSDSNVIARNIMKSKNVLTIPHTRYHYDDEKYFYFSVNLLANLNTILDKGFLELDRLVK